jgi:hypothetical protein
MRNYITLSIIRICGFALLVTLLVLIIPTTSYAEEPDESGNDLHTLEPWGRDATILTGRAQDVWSIELRECPTSLDLFIVDIHDYSEDEDWSPDAEDVYYDWHASASAGRWQWVQPTDYQWVLLVSNPTDDETGGYVLEATNEGLKETEQERTEPNPYVLGIWLICVVLINIAIMVLIVRPPHNEK